MTSTEFEHLLTRSEGSVTDFKSEMYDFNRNKEVISSFVKDIISMANTIRTETSFIIIGVREKDLGDLELLGIDRSIDDSVLQNKIKDKVTPRPKFSYSLVDYEDKIFGIIEIPIEKYEMPITPTVKGLKGLEVGKIYYRNGSSNSEATGNETIRISDWLRSLPDTYNNHTLNTQIGNFIKKLTKAEEKVSSVISELLPIAKNHKFEKLLEFCRCELTGFDNCKVNHDYRQQVVLFSFDKVDIVNNPYRKITSNLIKNEMEKNDDFFRGKLVLHHPLVQIEDYFEDMRTNQFTGFAIMESNSKDIAGTEKMHPMYIYIFTENFASLYASIRQKAIDLLMEL